MAKWRTPAAALELPAWVRRYVPSDWTSADAWLSACSRWLDEHPEEAAATWFDWIRTPQPVGVDGALATLSEWPWNPYEEESA